MESKPPAPRRRSSDGLSEKSLTVAWRVITATVSVVVAVLISYFTAQAETQKNAAAISERVSKVEERLDSSYREIMRRLDDQAQEQAEFRVEVKADFTGTRREVLDILKELRR